MLQKHKLEVYATKAQTGSLCYKEDAQPNRLCYKEETLS